MLHGGGAGVRLHDGGKLERQHEGEQLLQCVWGEKKGGKREEMKRESHYVFMSTASLTHDD